MPTQAEYRRHYEQFTVHVKETCTDPKARRTLKEGRGRPVDDCTAMHRFLTVSSRGYGQRRAHYTLAALIALADPLEEIRARRAASATSPVPTEPAPSQDSTVDAYAQAPTHEENAAPDKDPHAPAAWRARPNLGATLALAVRQAGFHEANTDELLCVLTRISADQLHRRLPSVVRRILDAGLTPDWPVLLDDLAQRDFDRGRVATRWLDAFYLTLHHTLKDPS